MASSKENPFSSKWFIFEEPPVANHRERVHFPEPARTRTVPSPSRTAPYSPNMRAKAHPVPRFTADRLLQVVAVVLTVLIASSAFQPLRTHYGAFRLGNMLEELQSYFPSTPAVDTVSPAVQLHVQQYLVEHAEKHVEGHVERYVRNNVEHLVQAIVERYVEANAERCIERHVQPHFTRHIEHVEHIVLRTTRAILRQQVIGRRDYAFHADGGRIVSKLTTGEATKSRNGNDNRLEVILRDNLGGGRCWNVLGSRAQVGISVAQLIHPSHITIDHVPAELTEDFQQAPRHMRLWGSVDGQQNVDRYKAFSAQSSHYITPPSGSPPITNNYNFVHLADFEYDVNASSHIQTFPVYDYIPLLGMDFGVFVVEVLDNWGGTSTCLYRIRLHGFPSSQDE